MRTIKVFLTVVAVFLLIAIGFGVYVWAQIQDIGNKQIEIQATEAISTEGVSENEEEEGRKNISSSTEEELSDTTRSSHADSDGSEAMQEASSVEIDVTTLSPEQQDLLGRLGIDTNTIVITPEMVACIQESLGSDRLDEIVNGETPSFLEALSAMKCLG